jgi:type I restriction-modification system DNA methylase subunit
MNLAVRGIDADIRWNNEGSFHRDALPDLRADFILANPPFNISDWGGERLREDARWAYGVPPAGNANYAWLQHILHHLSPTGAAGVVLANGSMSTQQSGEGDIRRAMVEGDVVDCMVALPPQLFYSTQIPACLWFLARDKRADQKGGRKDARDRRGEVLFIDARKLGHLVDRTRRELSDDDIARIAGAYHAWRGADGAAAYADEPGFCKAASLEEIRGHDHVLTPGRYVGAGLDHHSGQATGMAGGRRNAPVVPRHQRSQWRDDSLSGDTAPAVSPPPGAPRPPAALAVPRPLPTSSPRYTPRGAERRRARDTAGAVSRAEPRVIAAGTMIKASAPRRSRTTAPPSRSASRS